MNDKSADEKGDALAALSEWQREMLDTVLKDGVLRLAIIFPPPTYSSADHARFLAACHLAAAPPVEGNAQ